MNDNPPTDCIRIEGLEIDCVIGAWDWERRITQKVVVDIDLYTDVRKAAASDALDDAVDYADVAERVREHVVAAEATLVERLAERIAALVLDHFAVTRTRVRVAKPGAVRGARTIAVTIERRGGT